MKFIVIEGGKSSPPESPLTVASTPSRADVHAEAARRIKAAGYDQALVREFMTGRPMPTAIRNLQLQISFAGAAIATLSPIPADFRDDAYWPRAD